MIKKLMKSIREYKKDSLLSPAMVTLEVIMEVIIPMLMARLIDYAFCTLVTSVVRRVTILAVENLSILEKEKFCTL